PCVTAASEVRVGSAREYPRFDLAVVQARHHRNLKPHAAADAFYYPHELAPRASPSAGTHREKVDYASPVAAGSKGCDKDEAVLHVLAADVRLAVRSDYEMPALLPVEQAPEATVRVEAG